MSRTSRAAEAVTEVAMSAFSAPLGRDSLPRVLLAVQESVGSDVAGYYIHEWQGWTTPVSITPDAAWRILPFGRVPTATAVALHPGIRHCVVGRAETPFAVLDLISERAWQESEVVRGMRPDWGRNYQFAIPVSRGVTKAESHVWVLGRMTSGFTTSDRDVCEALAPVLSAVARHWVVLNSIELSSSIGGLLTEREVIVLRLQAEGVSARGIASRLGMSPRTAQKHAEHIYRKLGVHSRHDAVEACAMLGITVVPAGVPVVAAPAAAADGP